VQEARAVITLDGLKKAFQTSLKRNDYEVFDVIWDNANFEMIFGIICQVL
jgi:hypothetical protein